MYVERIGDVMARQNGQRNNTKMGGRGGLKFSESTTDNGYRPGLIRPPDTHIGGFHDS